jgi:hypothetical protein
LPIQREVDITNLFQCKGRSHSNHGMHGSLIDTTDTFGSDPAVSLVVVAVVKKHVESLSDPSFILAALCKRSTESL